MTFKELPVGKFFIIASEIQETRDATLMKKTTDDEGKECAKSMESGARFYASHSSGFLKPNTKLTPIGLNPTCILRSSEES